MVSVGFLLYIVCGGSSSVSAKSVPCLQVCAIQGMRSRVCGEGNVSDELRRPLRSVPSLPERSGCRRSQPHAAVATGANWLRERHLSTRYLWLLSQRCGALTFFCIVPDPIQPEW